MNCASDRLCDVMCMHAIGISITTQIYMNNNNIVFNVGEHFFRHFVVRGMSDGLIHV